MSLNTLLVAALQRVSSVSGKVQAVPVQSSEFGEAVCSQLGQDYHEECNAQTGLSAHACLFYMLMVHTRLL